MEKKGYQLKDLTKDPIQLLFFIFASFTVIMLVPFTYAGYKFASNSMQKAPKGYKWPVVTDFWMTGLSSVIFALIDINLRKVFKPMFAPYCKEQTNQQIKEIRSNKAAGSMYKFFYFLWATSWGYYVLKD